MVISKTILATCNFVAVIAVYTTNALKELASNTKKKHLVFVHGACHGAWTSYKLIAPLQKAGHNVTAIDMGASGRRPEKLTDLKGFEDYVKPLVELMEGLPPHEKVILVGHSSGGISQAWVTELYPEKVLANVFLAAFMPDTTNHAYHSIQQYFARLPQGYFLDSTFDSNFSDPRFNPVMLFGPVALKTKIYHKCPEEDLQLGLMLVRDASQFQQDLSNVSFTPAKYGAVPRIYIAASQDRALLASYQRVMIENYPPMEVKEIDTDHMPMLSAPSQLIDHLLEIAIRY